MTQDQWMTLLLKAVLIADLAGIVVFIADYSRLAPWWKNPIGRTIVIKDFLLLGVIALVVASVFFQFSRLTSRVAGWIQIAELGAMSIVMVWRVVVFERVHRDKGKGGTSGEDDAG